MSKIRVADEIKRLVYADPARTPSNILEELVGRGIKTTESSVTSYRADFLGSIAVLRELGAFTAVPPAAPKKAKKARAPSRALRWSDACNRAREGLEALQELQEEYREWKDNLPEGLQSSPVGEKLDAVCDICIDDAMEIVEEADGADLPMGFGRD